MKEELESPAVANLLNSLEDKEQSRLHNLGKQVIDDDTNQTGRMLAALANCSREVDVRVETLSLTLFALVTTDRHLNEPRYVTLPND